MQVGSPTKRAQGGYGERPKPLPQRIALHRRVETEIGAWSDEELLRRLCDSEVAARGRGTIFLHRSDARVFVKLLPVTALELEPRHRHSTANVFHLPTYYQYRIGGCGFGAWRELEAHRMANRWVLSGKCPHFPLLHSWRLVPIAARYQDDMMDLVRWGNHGAIAKRVSSIAEATTSAALFLEYFPRTLSEWLRDELASRPDCLAVVRETEAALSQLLTFINDHDFLHMDAHFENILTDGHQLFLSDYGLSISRTFRLATEELAFFEKHRNFDRCTAMTSLAHAIVTHYDPSAAPWRTGLRRLEEGNHPDIDKVPAAVRSYLSQIGPLALSVGEFYRELTNDLATEYPASSLQELLEMC